LSPEISFNDDQRTIALSRSDTNDKLWPDLYKTSITWFIVT